MFWFWKLHTGRQFFLANLVNVHFVFFWLELGNFGMISHFLRFLARSLFYLCEPEERLQRERYLLEREQGSEVRRLQQKHADFWQRWQEDPTYPSRLATSRERILGQPCSVEQLREYYLKLFEEEIETTSQEVSTS